MKKGLVIALSLVGAAAVSAVALSKCKCSCKEKEACCGEIDDKVVDFHHPVK